MGFGICLLGYCCLLCHALDGGFVGSVLLAVGLYMLSVYNKHFKYALISSCFLAFVGIAYIVFSFDFFAIPEAASANIDTAVNSAFIFFSLLLHYMMFTGIKRLSSALGDYKLARKSTIFMYLSLGYFLIYGMSLFFGELGSKIGLFLFIMEYVVIIANIIFLFDCYASITTESQLKKERAERKRQANEGNNK